MSEEKRYRVYQSPRGFHVLDTTTNIRVVGPFESLKVAQAAADKRNKAEQRKRGAA